MAPNKTQTEQAGSEKPASAKPKKPRKPAGDNKPPSHESVSDVVKHPGGRPSSYRKEFVQQAKKLAALGATDMDVADFFGVHVATIHRWKLEHTEFRDSLRLGKEVADERVVNSLYHRAVGYSHPEDDIRAVEGKIIITPTIKQYPPDTTAAIFWLKNRRHDEWRDKTDVNHGVQPDNPLASLLERVAGATIKAVKEGE